MSEKKQSLFSRIFKPKKLSCCNIEVIEKDDDEYSKEKSSCCYSEVEEDNK